MTFTCAGNGLLPEVIHSPASFAMKGRDFTVSAACCPTPAGDLPDYLELHLNGTEKFTMKASDGFESGDCRYEIYSCVIPGDRIAGDEIKYVIAAEGILSAISDTFTVEVIDEDALPAQPPVRITELFYRPKGKGVTGYTEVMNPSSADTDLYGYEILLYDTELPAGTVSARYPMADEPGQNILKPGEYAAILGLTKKSLENGLPDKEKFCSIFNADTVYRNLGVSPEECRIMTVKFYDEDPETGMITDKPGCPEYPKGTHQYRLSVVPRGRSFDDEVFGMDICTVYAEWDTPVRFSSYWTADIKNPSEGVRITSAAPATPGFPGRGQGKGDYCHPAPLILPVSPKFAVYTADESYDICFAVIDGSPECPVNDAYVNVGDARIRADIGNDGLWHAVVGEEYVRSLQEFTYSVQATDGDIAVSWNGGEDFSIPVYDNAGPCLTSMVPTGKYAYDANGDMTIRAGYYDVSGVRTGSCSLYIDGRDVSGDAEWTETSVSYSPDKKASAVGEHSLKLVLCDNLGNRSVKKVSYSVSDMEDLMIYRGQVHAHTSDSDGSGYPADAYEYARDTGHVDFFAVTDHSHYMSNEKYERQKKIADKFDDPGKFAAIYGWEMTWNNTCGFWGHVNMLNAGSIVQNIGTHTLPEMYEWLTEHREALGMFNHPGYPWGNFDEYAHYTPGADEQMCLSEIKGPMYDGEYAHMLSLGWHASPVCSEDNHDTRWTTATSCNGFVLCPSLTRQNVIDAFRARRTYMTSDPTMKIRYRVNGKWLGSHLDNPDRLEFDIDITTENPDGIGRVELVAEDNITVAVRDAGVCRHIHWHFTRNTEFDYYYLRITDGGRYSVTAPVWIDNREKPEIVSVDYAGSYNATDTSSVSVRVRNTLVEPLRDLRVKFVLSPMSGFRYGDAEPFCTAYLSKLAPGNTAKVSRLLHEKVGTRRFSVIATAKYRGRTVTSTAYIMLQPVSVAAVCADAGECDVNGKKVGNAFPYVTLYNSSPVDAKLDGGMLAPWINTGKRPPENRCFATNGITVPARGTVVVWDRHGLDLTADDFNSFYGTSLNEGTDLFVTDVHFTSDAASCSRLDFVMNGDVISRAQWNFGLENDRKHHPGVEHRYAYVPNMTSTLTRIGSGDPMPGTVGDEQMRRQFTVVLGRKERKQEEKAAKKDSKAEKRTGKLALTKGEGAALAGGAAATAATVAGLLAAIIKKKQ